MWNLQEQVKKSFCYPKLFWPFTVWKNCSSDLKNFANSRPSASNFKFFSLSLQEFFLTVGQNNFGNKIRTMFHDSYFSDKLLSLNKLTFFKKWVFHTKSLQARMSVTRFFGGYLLSILALSCQEKYLTFSILFNILGYWQKCQYITIFFSYFRFMVKHPWNVCICSRNTKMLQRW